MPAALQPRYQFLLLGHVAFALHDMCVHHSEIGGGNGHAQVYHAAFPLSLNFGPQASSNNSRKLTQRLERRRLLFAESLEDPAG
jgi:hypothetical protein